MFSKIVLMLAIVGVFAPAALAETYSVGQRVTIEDPHNKWGGGTISGTIDGDLGESYQYASRWHVKLDTGPSAYFDGWAMKPAGAGVVPKATPTQPTRPSQPVTTTTNLPVKKAPVPPGAVHRPTDWGRVPPRGSFKYGKPNMGDQLARTAITPPGLQAIYVRSSPGDESAVGRWYTRTGGVWTKSGNPDRDGNQMYSWGKQEAAELINVMPDGKWSMNNFGKFTQGLWYDIGQNVIRLVNFVEGEDWTASVHDHMIQFASPLGQRKEGNRY